MITRVLSNNFWVVSRFCICHHPNAYVCLLRESSSTESNLIFAPACSRYRHSLLEDNMAVVIHGLAGFGEMFQVTRVAWRSVREHAKLSYYYASFCSIGLGIIQIRILIFILKAEMFISCNFQYFIVYWSSSTMVYCNVPYCHYREVVRNHIWCWHREKIATFGESHQIKRMTMNVGRKISM